MLMEEIKSIIDKIEDELTKDCEIERNKKLDAIHNEAIGYKKACHEFAECLRRNLDNL